MRNRLLATIAACGLGLTTGLIVFAKAPKKPEKPEAGDTMMSDSMMSDSMMSDSMMGGGAAGKETPLSKTQISFFETKVRPILVKNCYECHSAEARKSKGGLVLDTREGWQKGGEDGKVIVPGNPDKSMLIKAIRYTDDDLQMPPDEKMRPEDIAVLTQWVRMGAPDPRTTAGSKLTGLNDKARAHWSYKPLKSPSVPRVKDTTWIKSPIDAFVLSKLEAQDMHPSEPATREALIRRATYDLIGLPPTPEEVEAFKQDTSPEAFEKVVNRLLASPHFGERWGRYWLDTARYSDTTGNDKNRGEYRLPYAWTYRDYVIQSFNADRPYDLFLKEQLAADLMPVSARDPSRLAALGFLTVGKRFQNPNDTIDERIDAVGKGMLGLTVACARCHDHKFDPISQADYYSLHGIFNSTEEPTEKPLIVRPGTNDEEYKDFEKQLAELEAKDRDRYYEIVGEKATEFRKDAAAYLMVGVIGRRDRADEINLRNKIIADHKLDRDIYQQYSNRYIRGNPQVFGPLIELARVEPNDFAGEVRQVLKQAASGMFRRKPLNAVVAKALAGLAPESIHSLQDVADVYGKLFADISPQAEEYFKACKAASKPGPIRGYDPAMVELFDLPAKVEIAADLTTDRLTDIAPTLPVINQQAFNKLNLAQVNELLLTHPGSPARAMVVEDSAKPRNSPIFIRGEALNRGPVVPRQFLEILSGPNRRPFTKGSGRLELAEAIASKSNPLTARVMVNRIWMHLFGQGFVRTPDDLGVQCEDPSHPELLDYLSRQFMNNGWSVKQEIRSIMLSSTYQQSCETNPAYAAKDSENRLLWRANLRRLDFESMRDSLLMFTGKLDATIGGKPVNLTDEPYSNRRSVYGYIDRGTLPELLSQFDFADPDMANSHRTSTIVPQQALFFMNSPMSVDVARKVTSRPEFLEAGDAAGRVVAIYSVLFQRAPSDEEIAAAMDFIDAASEEDRAPLASKKLTPQQQKQAKIAEARAAKQQEALEAALRRKPQGRAAMRGPIRNYDGTVVERRPLTPWEQYAQALLFTNEIAYEN